MEEKAVMRLYNDLMNAVSAHIDSTDHGTFEIRYGVQPVDGELARKLYEFALSCGYETRYSQTPRFNRSRKYTFHIESDGGDAVYISVVRVSPVRRNKRRVRRGAEEKRS